MARLFCALVVGILLALGAPALATDDPLAELGAETGPATAEASPAATETAPAAGGGIDDPLRDLQQLKSIAVEQSLPPLFLHRR